MTTRVVTTRAEVLGAIKLLKARQLPFTMEVVQGKRRSTEQNRLQRQWLKEIAEQLEYHSAEEWRGYCKLTLGVPILRNENEIFAVAYDRDVRPLSYEHKWRLMMLPIDVAVTRTMTTKQKTKYLDAMSRHFSEQGVELTQPDDLGRAT